MQGCLMFTSVLGPIDSRPERPFHRELVVFHAVGVKRQGDVSSIMGIMEWMRRYKRSDGDKVI